MIALRLLVNSPAHSKAINSKEFVVSISSQNHFGDFQALQNSLFEVLTKELSNLECKQCLSSEDLLKR